jgi:hypothetical protein
MVCVSDKLYALAAKRGWTNVDSKNVSWNKNFTEWKFKDDAKDTERSSAQTISFQFWDSFSDDFKVRWDYDKQANVYKRFTGGAAHVDLETGEQLSAKNVVIIFAKETGPVDEHKHMLYENIGSGTGYLFQDGKATDVTWRKATKAARLKLFDKSGKEISFVRGQIWVEMLPIGNEVTYQ